MFHQSNTDSQKTLIDKVFVNFDQVAIDDVYPTCENKEQDVDSELGHKAVLIRIGHKPPPDKGFKAVVWKTFKAKVRELDEDKDLAESIAKCDPDRLASREAIDELAGKVIQTLQNIVDQSTKRVKRKKKTAEKAAIDKLESEEEKLLKDGKGGQPLYRFAEKFFHGIDADEGKDAPSLRQFKNAAEDKLANLNLGDAKDTNVIINRLFGDSEKVIATFPTMKEFKRLVLSTSNSGAKDSHGLTLKLTKTAIRNSKTIRCTLYSLMRAMARLGYVPRDWKVDLISFLYKKKGDRRDAKNWRPITIAACLGKHFDKLLLFQLKRLRNINPDNHAYINDKSCLTAVLALMDFFKTVREKAKEAKEEDCLLIPMISLDDISSAFESIDHNMIDEVLRNTFAEGTDFDVRGAIRSYLDRKSEIVDRKTGEKVSLERTYDHKTSPQGSSLSPVLWRIFDAIFTEMYKEQLGDLIAQQPTIVDYFHIAYADGHVTVIVIKVHKDTCHRDMVDDINAITELIRDLLDNASKDAGCGINPSKQKPVIPPAFIGD